MAQTFEKVVRHFNVKTGIFPFDRDSFTDSMPIEVRNHPNET